jgi:hypothetical protein
MILSMGFDVLVVAAIAAGFRNIKRPEARSIVVASTASVAIGIVLMFVFGGKFHTVFLGLAPAFVVVAFALEWQATGFLNGFSFACAYWLGWWMASAIRQIQYELSNFGRVTNAFDSCAAALAPFVVVIILVTLALAGGIGALVSLKLRPLPFIATCTACCLLGALHGNNVWIDWQPDRPCM